MTELPKLIVKNHFRKPVEEKICDFQEARMILNDYLPKDLNADKMTAFLVAVEGQLIHSYDELLEIANQDFYKDRELLEVVIHPAFGGG